MTSSNPIRAALLVAVLPLLFVPLNIQAQDLDYGVTLSRNASYLHGNYTNSGEDISVTLESDISWNYDAGAYLRFNLTRAISIQPELYYSTRGTRFKDNVIIRDQDMRVDGRLRMTHIELPVLFRITNREPIPDPPVYARPGYSFHVFSGLSVAYNTRSRFSGNLSGDLFGVNFDEAFSSDVRHQFSDTDLNFIAGAGLEYGRHTRFTVDIRYKVSVLDVGAGPEFRGDMRFSTISLGMGVVL